MVNKIIEDLELEIQKSSSNYESKKLKYKLSFFKRATSERPEYDYSKVEYKGATTKINLCCKEHGNFETTPQKLFKGGRCPTCTKRDKSLKLTKSSDTFIKQVQEVSPQYDYSKVVYKHCKEKVEVICSVHGSFFAQPNTLLKGCGCKQCSFKRISKNKGLDLDEFLKRVKHRHQDKFKIFKETYTNKRGFIKIECEKHGVLNTRALQLLESDYGCPKCGEEAIYSKNRVKVDELNSRIFNKFGNKIKIDYTNQKTLRGKVKAYCTIHGKFSSSIHNILKSNYGCPKCYAEIRGLKQITPFEIFLEKANKKFKNKFKYIKDTYLKGSEKMVAICPTHGEFKIIPSQHLTQTYGCFQCMLEDNEGEMNKYRAYSNNPTMLYYVKILKEDKVYFKIGITTKTLKSRFNQLKKEDAVFKDIVTRHFETGKEAYSIEQEILSKNKKYLIDFELLPLTRGNSEIFSKDIYEKIKHYF